MGRKEIVIRVIDGDTFQTASRKKPVRLANVNAPGKGRPGAAQATRILRNLIEGERVRIEPICRDSYGRTLAKVYLGRESVNRKLVEELEDLFDVSAARRALKEPGTVQWEKVKKELGLREHHGAQRLLLPLSQLR